MFRAVPRVVATAFPTSRPFRVSRVNTVPITEARVSFEDFQLDKANALLWRRNKRIFLAPKPFDVLCYLSSRPGQLVTKEDLLNEVWSKVNVCESSLSVAVSQVRSALGDRPTRPRFVETVTRRGYRFIAEVFVDN
jgi:DNA-binding winged helix-turn-helix (wHTH) protein